VLYNMEKEKSNSLLQRVFPQTHAFVSKLKPAKKIKAGDLADSIDWKKHTSGFYFNPPQPGLDLTPGSINYLSDNGAYHAIVQSSYPVVNRVPAGPFSGVDPDLGMSKDAKQFYSNELLKHFDRTPESFGASTHGK
jgi:hypothetical protein